MLTYAAVCCRTYNITDGRSKHGGTSTRLRTLYAYGVAELRARHRKLLRALPDICLQPLAAEEAREEEEEGEDAEVRMRLRMLTSSAVALALFPPRFPAVALARDFFFSQSRLPDIFFVCLTSRACL
jgi:hypothetical protein